MLSSSEKKQKLLTARLPQMLKRMMEFKGPVPTRMIKSHLRAFETMGGIRPHFTEGGQFMQQEPDPVTGEKCDFFFVLFVEMHHGIAILVGEGVYRPG